MSVKFDGKKYDYFFKRNSLGFIGEEINPEEIKIIFLGGSTEKKCLNHINIPWLEN